MCDGSGEYSSSMATVPLMSSSLIAWRYGSNLITPRPGGRSPWTLPSQSLMWTWMALPLSLTRSIGLVSASTRWLTSILARTRGWVHSSTKRAMAITLLSRLRLERDVDFLFVGVVAEDATGLDSPAPLFGRRDDFSLPNVFAEHEENVFRTPLSSKVDEGFAALHVEGAYGFVEVDKAGRDDGKRNDGQVFFPARVQHQVFFLRGNGHGLREDVHAIEADAGDVLEADCGVHAGLAERAVDDAKFHRFWISGTLKTKFCKLHRPGFLR